MSKTHDVSTYDICSISLILIILFSLRVPKFGGFLYYMHYVIGTQKVSFAPYNPCI